MLDPFLDAESDVESIPTIRFHFRGRFGVENDLLNENLSRTKLFIFDR